MHGFYRVAAATPLVRLADVAANVARTRELMAQAQAEQAALVVFPELGLTGYTCADLFHQSRLLAAVLDGIAILAEHSGTVEQSATVGDTSGAATAMLTVVGAPLLHANRLYNCAVVFQAGRVLGVVPKSFLPTYKEFYDKRWFTPGGDVAGAGTTIRLGGVDVPFGVDLLFDGGELFRLGIEICEDLWNVIPPSSRQALAGATICANPSASNELVAKSEYRRDLIANQSARCVSAYVYASSGTGESTTDVVYGGHALIAENGAVLAENERFRREPGLVCADIDCERLVMTRITETSFGSNPTPPVRWVALPLALPTVQALRRHVDPRPFVPSNPALRDERCKEIFQIQSTALANRLAHIGAKVAVIGISGGLDSTLALLVTAAAWHRLGHDASRIVTITMPGYGTTDRTYANAVKLCRELGTEFHEVNIVAACEQHFKDIGHDPRVHDVTYENVQARERTQILMDLANKRGGIVIGTGDLSEIALGWSTYNGDHMSMYAVNCGVPKTLIRYLIHWEAERQPTILRETLEDVLDTPISPELLPKGADGSMVQRTEDVIGPYELHDFFLYHAIKYGAPPAKIAWLAGYAFAGSHDAATIDKWLTLFVRRFFNNQFKRSCIPDGPKVGSIALSPRGDWRMPSDAVATLWLTRDEAGV